jgi:hypothetical protein
MHARFADELSPPGQGSVAALKAIARHAVTILCLAAVASAVVGVRYLVFEYNHGTRQMVLNLIER